MMMSRRCPPSRVPTTDTVANISSASHACRACGLISAGSPWPAAHGIDARAPPSRLAAAASLGPQPLRVTSGLHFSLPPPPSRLRLCWTGASPHGRWWRSRAPTSPPLPRCRRLFPLELAPPPRCGVGRPHHRGGTAGAVPAAAAGAAVRPRCAVPALAGRPHGPPRRGAVYGWPQRDVRDAGRGGAAGVAPRPAGAAVSPTAPPLGRGVDDGRAGARP